MTSDELKILDSATRFRFKRVVERNRHVWKNKEMTVDAGQLAKLGHDGFFVFSKAECTLTDLGLNLMIPRRGLMIETTGNTEYYRYQNMYRFVVECSLEFDTVNIASPYRATVDGLKSLLPTVKPASAALHDGQPLKTSPRIGYAMVQRGQAQMGFSVGWTELGWIFHAKGNSPRRLVGRLVRFYEELQC